ncbi:exported hypothetical protein [Bacillus pumilus]
MLLLSLLVSVGIPVAEARTMTAKAQKTTFLILIQTVSFQNFYLCFQQRKSFVAQYF